MVTLRVPGALRLWLSFVLVLNICAADKSEKAAVISSPEGELKRIDAQYLEAFNKKDALQLAALYSQDAEIYHPNKDVIRGRDAIQRFWVEDLAQTHAKQTTEILAAEVDGNTGILAGKWTLTGKQVLRGKYLVVLKKIDGKWQITREIWNYQTD